MLEENNQKSRAERLLERSNKPILILAALAVVLYILELFRIVPRSWMTTFMWINFLIDFIFLIDLLSKCFILGRGYLRSPWFLIDFVSTLPIISSTLELLGNLGPQLQATRVARGARVARIARIARIARVARVARLVSAIRATQGLTFLKTDSGPQDTPSFNKALLIGVPVLLVAFILVSAYIKSTEVAQLQENITQQIEQAQNLDDLEAIKREYDVNTALYPATETTVLQSQLNGGQEVPVSLEKAYTRADRLAGILLLLVLITIGMSIQISSALAKDRSKNRERSILSQCFSPPIVSKFYSSPEVIERFYNHWMTVFFIDIRGFTQVAQKDMDDIEGLALKLRQVMDTARNEIVVTHEGVIDKFMGDAVMGWVGGHFSAHWELLSEVRQKLKLDELDLIEQDIKSIRRELKKIDKPHKTNKSKQNKIELESILKEAQEKKTKLKAQQKLALDQDKNLEDTHQKMILEYRRRVARSAVSCCLKISKAVEKIEDPDAFHELKIGVGSGPVLVGNFGSTEQIGFTVLGPTVNRSARLEPASAQCGCNILIDQTTYDLLKDNEDLRFRRVPRFVVQGISDEMITYEPFFADQVSESFLAQFEEGVVALEKGNTQKAIDSFNQANELRPGGDAAAKLWSEECVRALEEGHPVGIKSMSK